MFKVRFARIALAVGLALSGTRLDAVDTKPLPPPLGIRLPDWSLPIAGGQTWSLARDGRDAKAVVVLFLGTQCPVNNLYAPTLKALHTKYSTQGVVFVGVNSNAQDDAAAVARHAKEYGLPFVVLKDDGAKLADRFAAARTPEAFVLDGTRTVRYRGRIDDRYDKGVQRVKPTRHDLADAIDAVLTGKGVERPVTEAAGCPIARPPHRKDIAANPVTFTKHVAPLLQQHCQECHRPGEVAPFSLLTYKDAAGWSAALKEEVAARRMPPWHADPAHGEFRNCRRLPDDDCDTLLTWVDQGCPEGDPADLPPPRTFVDGWHIGKPDAVFTMPVAAEVPAQGPKGGVPYKFVLVSEPFAEDKWVQHVECRPSAAAVVHHITAFLVLPGTDVSNFEKKSDVEILLTSYSDDCFLGGYGPGEDPMTLPPGQAKRIPKGARVALEVHYAPNGMATSDRSCVGFIYAKEPPAHRVWTGSAMNWLMLVPPGAANHKVVATRTFEKSAMLLSFCPHMHMRGKSMTMTLIRPDGSREIGLSVPRYDFGWQTNYYVKDPIYVPKGTKVECVAYYDNSADNPNNPDPTKFVTWGQQSWEEMMCGFFEYYWADEKTEK